MTVDCACGQSDERASSRRDVVMACRYIRRSRPGGFTAGMRATACDPDPQWDYLPALCAIAAFGDTLALGWVGGSTGERFPSEERGWICRQRMRPIRWWI